MRLHIDRLARCNRGATAVEYGLIVALIVLPVMAGITALGGASTTLWNDWSAKFVAATR